MKQTTLTAALLLLILTAAFAQSNKLTDEKIKEFEAQKIAFFTHELEITPEEAIHFWPLYNEMQKKHRDIEQQRRQACKALAAKDSAKEADYLDAIRRMQEAEQRILDLRKEYYALILRHLPASKLWKLESAERKFHRQLLNKLNHTPQK